MLPKIPTGISPIARRVPRDFEAATHGEGSEEEEITRNLEGLTIGIPDYLRFEDVPHAYHRHIVGVSNRIHHLLRWLVRTVTCYHEHHANQMLRIYFCIFLRDMMSQDVTKIHIFFELMMHVDANNRYV